MIPFALEAVEPITRPTVAPAPVAPVRLVNAPYSQLPAVNMRLDFTGEPEFGSRRQASPRATTSSRTPGKVNRGVVYASDFEHSDFHVCTCGQTQKPCSSCGAFICEAPGHAKHVCGSAW